MLNSMRLFTTFHGRIGRLQWWVGAAVLFVLSVATSYLIDPEIYNLSNRGREATFSASLLVLFWAVPWMAITLKRLNDRDQPRWIGYAVAGAIVLFPAAQLAGADVVSLVGVDSDLRAIGIAMLVLAVVLRVWVDIANGFQKGTNGPNRHGPDPLRSGNPPPPTSVPGEMSRRSRGATVRNVAVGVVATIFALVFMPPGTLGEMTVPTMSSQSEPLNESVLEAWKQSEIARDAGDFDEALGHIGRAIEESGPGKETAPFHRERARIYRSLNQPNNALREAETAVQLDAESEDGFGLLGQIQADIGNWSAAFAAYDEALRINPDDSYVHLERGELLNKLNRTDEALAAFAKVVEVATQNRGRLEQKLEEEKRFLVASRKRDLEREAANLQWAHFERAKIYADSARDAEAFSAFGAALEWMSNRAATYASRGFLYEMRGELDRARTDYERALELDPQEEWSLRALEVFETHDRRSFAHWRRANIYRDAGKLDEARVAYDEAIRFAPGSWRPYAERGSLNMRAKNYSDTITDMDRVLAIDSDKHLAYAMRAAARLELGDSARALADVSEALRREPNDQYALTTRGRVYEKQKEFAKARADYEAAAKLYPDDPWLKRALERFQ